MPHFPLLKKKKKDKKCNILCHPYYYEDIVKISKYLERCLANNLHYINVSSYYSSAKIDVYLERKQLCDQT